MLQCGQNNVESLCPIEHDQQAIGTAESRTLIIIVNSCESEACATLRRERRTAAAGPRGVRIDEVEALTHQRLFVVQRHAVEIQE